MKDYTEIVKNLDLMSNEEMNNIISMGMCEGVSDERIKYIVDLVESAKKKEDIASKVKDMTKDEQLFLCMYMKLIDEVKKANGMEGIVSANIIKESRAYSFLPYMPKCYVDSAMRYDNMNSGEAFEDFDSTIKQMKTLADSIITMFEQNIFVMKMLGINIDINIYDNDGDLNIREAYTFKKKESDADNN